MLMQVNQPLYVTDTLKYKLTIFLLRIMCLCTFKFPYRKTHGILHHKLKNKLYNCKDYELNQITILRLDEMIAMIKIT